MPRFRKIVNSAQFSWAKPKFLGELTLSSKLPSSGALSLGFLTYPSGVTAGR